MPKKSVLIGLALFGILISCNEPMQVGFPSSKESGSAKVVLAASANSPFQKIARSASLSISANDMLTISKALSVSDSGVFGTIANIPAGYNRLFYIAVFDSLGKKCYTGQAISDVIADSIIQISIMVRRIGGTAVINGTIVEDTMPTNGLLAYYPFNGNAYDESGNGNDGINYGAVLTTDRFGDVNSSYLFDGTSSKISVADAANLKPDTFTIAAWIKMDHVPTGVVGTIFGKQAQNDARTGYALYITGYNINQAGLAALVLTDGTDAYETHTTSQIPTETWKFLVATANNSKVDLYLNGVLVQRQIIKNSSPVSNLPSNFHLAHNSDPVGIGYENVIGQNRYFTGNIDDIRFYNRVLTTGEIQQLYHEGGWVGN